MSSSLATRINWTGGVQMEDGNLEWVSRFGVSPTPSGNWSTSQGTGASQADNVLEMPFTLTSGSSLVISLVGANGEVNVLNQPLSGAPFTVVKSVEVILTTPPATGVSLQLGPQGVSDAAQLWFEAATTNFYDIVRDQFCNRDRAVGWPIASPNTNLPIKNPSAASVSGWIRVIGV